MTISIMRKAALVTTLAVGALVIPAAASASTISQPGLHAGSYDTGRAINVGNGVIGTDDTGRVIIVGSGVTRTDDTGRSIVVSGGG